MAPFYRVGDIIECVKEWTLNDQSWISALSAGFKYQWLQISVRKIYKEV